MDERKQFSPDSETYPEDPSDYVAEVPFSELPLSPEVQQGIADHGYERPTPVQAAAIPKVLEGRDLIVRSKTGTGKTAAFSIPMVEKIPAGSRQPRALVLCPTRELAAQVAEEAAALAKHKDLRVAAIYGGASMNQQFRALEEGAEVIVGTPGRVYDHIRRKTLDLSGVQIGVLDEADEMLSMGFFEEVTRILGHLPKERQTLLFSATVSPDIERIIKQFLKDPEMLLLSGETYTVEGIEHVAYDMVEDYPKPRNLLYLLELENPETAIIFANTRDDTALLTAVLNRNGYDADVLSGDLPQKERERVMAKMKRGEVRFLVATDLAARGIDISDLSHVVNYALPEDPAVYLHRVGRTGRIGKSGTAVSLIGGRDRMNLDSLARQYGIAFEKRKLPSAEDARRLWTERHVVELREEMGHSVFEAFIPLAQELRKRPDGDLLMAAALKSFFTQRRIEKARQKTEGEEPVEETPVAEAQPRERRGREREGRQGRERRGEGRGRERERRPEAHRQRRDEAPEAPVAAEAPQEAGAAPEAREQAEGAAREPSPFVKLFLNLGSEDGLDEEGVRGALAELASAETQSIDRVELRGTFSFAYVAREAAAAFLAANGATRDEKEIRIERSRRRRR